MDDAGSFELLDAEEERRQARRLRELRRACWQTVLEEPELVKGFLVVAREVLDKEAAQPIVAWAERRIRSQELCECMLDVDPDGSVLARLESVPPGAPVSEVGDVSEPVRRLRRARREYLSARNRFMCANLRLVVTVAKRYGRHHMPLADRVQEGNIGLLKAIDRFDPERGFRFSTYAAWWIRHAVTRALVKHGRTVRIPAHLHTLFTKARRARTAIRGELGRNPTMAEVAERINAPLDKVHAAVKAMELRAIGLDDPAKGEGGQAISEVLPDEDIDGWADRIGDRIDARLAAKVVGELDPMAFEIVVHRFGLEGLQRRTLRSLGEDYALSRERIRQLQNKALRGLRDVMEHSSVSSLAVA